MHDKQRKRLRELPPPVAQRQAGAFSAAQALAVGMTRNQVGYRLKTGVWRRVAGAALRHRDDPVTPWMLAFASHLTWPDSVVCGPSVAALHNLPVPSLNVVHVIAPVQTKPRYRMVLHQVRLDPEDLQTWRGIKVTRRGRGILDALVMLPEHEAQSLFVWARTRDKLRIEEFEKHLAQYPGRWGNRRLRDLLDDARKGIMSVAEARAHEVLHSAGLTGWEADIPISDEMGVFARADILFRKHRLVINIDGRAFHGPDKFQSERTRANRLAAAGYRQLSFTWDDLTLRPHHVAEQIRMMLAR